MAAALIMREPVDILLIDDEPRNLDVLESILDSPDYRLVRAQSVDEALRLLIAREFAVLVLDIRMPGTSGLELAQMLKRRKATRHVPIIFLTAYYHEDEHVLKGYDAGAVDYLRKPCNPAILRSKVAIFADLHRKNRALEAENQMRREAEEQLRQAYEVMEDRVRERTAALEQTNEALRRGEASLLASEERFRVSLQNAPITVFTSDLELRYTWIHSHLGGLPAERMIQCTDDELLPPEFATPLRELKLRAIETGRAVRAELPAVLEGTRHVFDITIEPLRNAAGQIEGLTAAMMDVTAPRETAEELRELSLTLEQKVVEATSELRRKADQLRMMAAELNRAKEQERKRLAQVLHDGLQQLLVAARMRVVSVPDSPDPVRRRQTLDQVREILDEAIHTSRSLTAELSPPILYNVGVLPALEWLAHWMKDKHGVDVELYIESEAEPQSESDRVLLFDAARELLFNSVKHAGATRASLALSRVPEGYLLLTVEDEGPGFDPDAVFSAPASGGLGLISLRERIEPLGGRLDVVSSRGGGARVSVCLPCVPSASGSVGEAAPRLVEACVEPARTEGNGAVRVLLADDHKIVRDGIRMVLEARPGIEVVGEASDGEQAVELALELKPDVVVMDVFMPRMNGVEATRRIVEQVPATRVIGLSMHQGDEMADSMQRAGAAGYLSKDGPTEDLVAAIRGDFEERRGRTIAQVPPIRPQPPAAS